MTRCTLFALVAAAVFATSCNNSPTTPTDTTPTRVVSYFTGVMGPGESAFYSFTVNATASTEVTLFSLLPDSAKSPALAIPMSISIGTPAGTGCRAATTVVAAPGLSPQIAFATTPTIYCVSIADFDQLTGPVTFTIKILHP